jgi:hypothetical protein
MTPPKISTHSNTNDSEEDEISDKKKIFNNYKKNPGN